MRGCVFLESMPSNATLMDENITLPPICISEDTSRFRYTYRGGLRSAIRVARVVSDIVALNHPNVRWTLCSSVWKRFQVYSCLTELGVGLTHEPGFHQFDVRGNAHGLLAAHPLTPLVSLHHIDHIDPIFPNMTTTKALQHLLHATNVDSQRILQQTICYDRRFSRTVSVSWGYAVQLYDKRIPLPDVLPVPETFRQWKWGNVLAGVYTFNTRKFPPHPCHRPTIFFLDSVCLASMASRLFTRNLMKIACFSWIQRGNSKKSEFSPKLDLDYKQAPRRHCCDVFPTKSDKLLDITIRECGEDELIYMHE
ncbi:FHA domain-containing protein DDL-like [Hibiscus syriacus]|uniref:FHA domain-containing protein DDL-like n=1 Tax=Hibiscus syriacus TaxID=106335 RepID=A0A6A2Y8Q1_HIBSY|nr:FHA domain-containing protein DDL-like [Hibiscus syriacus]